MRFLLNTILSAVIIAGSAEISRRSSFLAAVLISLPMSSIVALSLTYVDSGDTAKVAALSTNILLLFIPSILLFLTLPALLRHGWNFWPAMGTSCLAMAAFYAVYSYVLKQWGIRL